MDAYPSTLASSKQKRTLLPAAPLKPGVFPTLLPAAPLKPVSSAVSVHTRLPAVSSRPRDPVPRPLPSPTIVICCRTAEQEQKSAGWACCPHQGSLQILSRTTMLPARGTPALSSQLWAGERGHRDRSAPLARRPAPQGAWCL